LARKPYEFGVKSAVVVTHRHGLMVGARTFPGNPFDGHILSAVLQQASNVIQDVKVTIKQVVPDLGFRGKQVDADNPHVQIIHRGRYKRMSKQERRWLKRRQTVEPAIGHLKSDHRMDRCWLQGQLGDALHTISCAAGYNLRWLLRAIVGLKIAPTCLCLLQMALSLAMKAIRLIKPLHRPRLAHRRRAPPYPPADYGMVVVA
jgi:transposase, IS5 family